MPEVGQQFGAELNEADKRVADPEVVAQAQLRAAKLQQNGEKLADALSLVDAIPLKPANPKLKAPRLPDGEA